MRFSFKKNIWLIIFLLTYTLINAQDYRIDSLENILFVKSKKDTFKVNLLNNIAYEYRYLDNKKLYEYANRANILSDSLNFDFGRLKSLNLLGLYYWSISDYQKALNLHEQALAISERINNVKGQSESHYYIGNIYHEKGDYSKTIEHHQKALEIQKFIGDSSGIARIYNSIGMIYRIKGDYPKALEYCQKSLKIKKQIGDKQELATVYNNIGNIYYYQNNFPKALEYYTNSLNISKETNDKISIVTSYNNIGIVYFYEDEYAKALDYFQNALAIQEEIDDKTGKAISYINIGEIFVKQNKLNYAWDYYYKGLQLSIELEIKSVEGWSNWGLGVISSKRNNKNKAYRYAEEAYKIGEETGEIELIQLSSEILSQVTADLGLYKEAYNYHKIYKELSDSIQSEENTRKVIGLEYEYRYQAEKEEQEKREALQLAKYQRQQFLTIIFIISSILMIVLVFFIFRNYKRKQQDYKIISDRNEKINQQKQLLEQQALKLKQLDEIKSRFFTNISHEFRTPLTLIIGPIEQLLAKVKDINVTESLMMMLRNAHKLLDLINQLLEISKIEKGNIKLKFQKDDIKKEINFIIEMFSSMAEEKNLKLELNSDNTDYTCYFDKEKVGKIIINLLSNAFKHTKEGIIQLDLKKSKENGKILITVTDSGIGIRKEKLPYIFDRFYQANNNETDETAGTGIGLSYIKELINLYKGVIKVESEVGKGSKFNLELPASLEYFEKDEYELVSANSQTTSNIISTDINGVDEKEKNKETKKTDTILVVEDHSDLRSFIASSLSELYNTIEAENGEEGIKKALQELPDMIITDIMMPKVNGIELTKTLKNNENTSHIPIIMLTAKSSDESKIEGLETEADDYLTKPFNIKELQVRIRNLLKIRRKLQEKYNKSITVNPSEITTTSVDEKFLQKLLKAVEDHMSDSEFSVEMLCELVGMSRANVHKKLKHIVNQSATEFINSVRLKRAAQLIQQNAGNISEIAYDVGFNNLSYFSRAFKKHFKITPKEMMENTVK